MPETKHSYKALVTKLITGLVFGVGILLLLLFLNDFDHVVKWLSRLSLHTILLAILLVLIGYGLRFLKWQSLMRPFKKQASISTNLTVFLIGLGMAITPGKSGEFLKPYLLKKASGIPASQSSAAVLIDRLSDLVAMLVLLVISSLIFPKGYVVAALFLCLLIIGFALLFNKKSVLFLVGLLTQSKLKAFRFTLLRVIVTLQRLLKIQLAIRILLLSVAAWVLECVALFLLTNGLNLSLSFLQDTLVFSLGTVAGALSFLPGGLGAADGSMLGLFVLFQVPHSIAAAITLLIRVITLWLAVWIGFFTFLIKGKKFMK